MRQCPIHVVDADRVKLVFGTAPLDTETVRQVTDRLLAKDAEVMPILEKIGVIYDRLIARLPAPLEYSIARHG